MSHSIHLAMGPRHEDDGPERGLPKRLVEVVTKADEALVMLEIDEVHFGHVVETTTDCAESVVVFRPA